MPSEFHQRGNLGCQAGFLCRSGFSSGGRGQHQDDLASNGCSRSEFERNLSDWSAQKLFVQLGEFARDDDVLRGSEDGLDVGEGVEDAVRGFVEDVRCVAARGSSSSAVLRWPALAGRNPWKMKRSVGRPLAMSALMAAFAPGMGKTAIPAAMAAAAICAPGSAMPGVPASLTTAIRPPAFSSVD